MPYGGTSIALDQRMSAHETFRHAARRIAHVIGTPGAFLLAVLAVLVWAASGPLFGFSDTWQLVINTGTTIITFLVVFLIQNTQNRDTEAMQIKLDELIRATANANNALLNLEELDQSRLDAYRRHYLKLAAEAREGSGGTRPTGTARDS